MIRSYLHPLLMLCCTSSCLVASSRAEDVVIENHGQRTFYYALRDGAAWSKTHDIAPGEKKSHVTSSRLRVSYLTDAAQFAWLDAKKTYRIDDVAKGRLRAVTQVRRPALPGPTSDPENPTASSETKTDATAETDPPLTSSEPEATKSAGTTPMPGTPMPETPMPETPMPETPMPETTAPPTPAPKENDAPTADRFEALFDVANRVVTVRAIADDRYRTSFPEWRERARRIVAGASDYYQREYSIRLVLTDTSAWQYDGVADDLDSRWARLLEQSPAEVDLIVALVGYGDFSSVKGEATFTGQLGRAAFFGQHLMIADRKDYHENRAKTVLIHELGHIFGAFHVADQNLMMYPGYLQLPTDAIIAGTVPFGETIDEVFSITKEFDFRTGVNSLSPVVQRRLQALYRQHGLPLESRQTDPITSGFKYLQRRAQIVAEQMGEHAETSRGVFDGLAE